MKFWKISEQFNLLNNKIKQLKQPAEESFPLKIRTKVSPVLASDPLAVALFLDFGASAAPRVLDVPFAARQSV